MVQQLQISSSQLIIQTDIGAGITWDPLESKQDIDRDFKMAKFCCFLTAQYGWPLSLAVLTFQQ